MGTCRSKAAATETSVTGKKNLRHAHSSNNAKPNVDSIHEPLTISTGPLLRSILPTAMPLVCQVVSQQLIADPARTPLLKNEEPLTDFDKNAPMEEQVLRHMQLNMAAITLVDAGTLQKEMDQMPTFAWPVRDRVAQLMANNRMRVFDLVDFDIKIWLGKGIEFVVPVVNSLGIPMTLEIGCGGEEIGDDAWLECTVPRLRIWVLQDKAEVKDDGDVEAQSTNRKHVKAFIAFFGRPNLTPHLHVNADRGKGDFFDMVLDEAGSLDDVVESILMGFGPTEYYKKQKEQEKQSKTKQEQDKPSIKQSWVGNALGKVISRAMGSFVGVGNNRPLEIDLTDAVTGAINTAMGKPRPVEVVQAHIERLQKELENSKKAEQEETAAIMQKASSDPATKPKPAKSTSSEVAEEKKEDELYQPASSEGIAVVDRLDAALLTPFASCCGYR
jgi:hypothetical protein